MVEEAENLHFFKRNVNNSVSVRFFYGDRDGIVLNSARPMVEVEEKKLKVFKEVNRNALNKGLLLEISEPTISWETANALSDDDISALLSNWFKFKNTIDSIDSVPILYKMLDAATEKGSAKRITSLISARIAEVEPQEDMIAREEMGGSMDIGSVG